MVKYIIFFHPRCGSTYIASRLNNSDYSCINGYEIAAKETINNWSLLTDDQLNIFNGSDFAELNFVQKLALDKFYHKYEHFDFIGAKVAPYQLADTPGYFQHALKRCSKFVFLYRQNVIDVALSSMWSLIRSQQGEKAWLEKGEIDTVLLESIDREVFEYNIYTSILQRDAVLSLYRSCQKDKILFSYEDFFAKKDSSFKNLCEFIGITDDLPESNLVKIHGESKKFEILKNNEHIIDLINQLYGGLEAAIANP